MWLEGLVWLQALGSIPRSTGEKQLEPTELDPVWNKGQNGNWAQH